MVSKVICLAMLLALSFALGGCDAVGVERLPTPTGMVHPYEAVPAPQPGETPQPAMLERRLLVLEWPKRILEKDSAIIWLKIAMDEEGRLVVTPTGQNSGGTSGEPVTIPNLYETHNIVAVARLDLAGLEAYREEMREPLRPGKEVTFRWSVRANESGAYRGVVWLHLELVPKNGGPIDQLLLLGRTIEIEAVTILGLNGNLARVLGTVGLVVSSVLGFPLIQQGLQKLVKRRKPTPRKRPAAQPEGQSKQKDPLETVQRDVTTESETMEQEAHRLE